jgi:NADH:ubiquinone oxidoreductase subunit 5 (subunit L)/multisubunit Na+/H+ antiporter MnhA subunit
MIDWGLISALVDWAVCGVIRTYGSLRGFCREANSISSEGPTPVSALIHAATMVTAGVYLLIRCSPLLEQSLLALNIILIIGVMTSFVAASIGLFQNDIKKTIAYSTMSLLALGYIC